MKIFKLVAIISIITTVAIAGTLPGQFDDHMGKDWFGIYMQDNKIGYGSIELVKDNQNRWVANTEMTFSFLMHQMPTNMSSSETRIYAGNNAELVYNKFINTNDAGVITVEGEIQEKVYNVVINIAGQKTIKSFTPPVETLSDVLKIEMLAADGKLKVGDKFEISTFEAEPPMTSKFIHLMEVEDKHQLVFSGVSTDVYIVSDSLPAIGVKAQITVDINGNILQQGFAPLGMVIRSEPEELAKQLDSDYDLLANNIIKAENGPTNPRDIDSAVYIISGYDVSSIPESDWLTVKTFSPDSAEISIGRNEFIKYEQTIPVTDDRYNIYLQPEPLIQSDSEEIIELAIKIIGDESNAFRAALLINDWVHDNIRKEFSPDISNALQTLKTGRGDCGEHSALTVALLRASGIPSRIAAGAAYWPGGNGFAFHAWTEVYVGDWIQMDPTWGETFADATHIMLARGGLENQVGPVLNALIGLKIRFLSYK